VSSATGRTIFSRRRHCRRCRAPRIKLSTLRSANNSDLVSIAAQVRAAERDVQVARADRLPTVNAIGSGRATNFLGTADEQFGPNARNTQTSTGVGVQGRIPIYQGGLVGARVRQGQAFQAQLTEQGVATERAVIAQRAGLMPLTRPRSNRSSRMKRQWPRIHWRSKACAPSRPLAPATCLMC
jgi:hypothetical protein